MLVELRALIDSFPDPCMFGIRELDYNHAARMDTLMGVVAYMERVQHKYPGVSEMERLCNWAISVRPEQAYNVGVKGFGLASFQYLRMLLGAQTTKPDRHILEFVSEALGRSVSAEEALYLLEHAARKNGLPIREVDGEIWGERAAP